MVAGGELLVLVLMARPAIFRRHDRRNGRPVVLEGVGFASVGLVALNAPYTLVGMSAVHPMSDDSRLDRPVALDAALRRVRNRNGLCSQSNFRFAPGDFALLDQQ